MGEKRAAESLTQREQERAAPVQQKQEQAEPVQQKQEQTAPAQREQEQTAPVQREQEQTAPVQQEQLQQALDTLWHFVRRMAEQAGLSEEYAKSLWQRIRKSGGLLQELAYYHDYGGFLCKYEVAGYTLADILVWQVDHFKLYMDRPEEMNRYRRERLLLETFETMASMEENPEPFAEKMRAESGQDAANG